MTDLNPKLTNIIKVFAENVLNCKRYSAMWVKIEKFIVPY